MSNNSNGPVPTGEDVVMKTKRPDGRKSNELRQPSIEFDLLNRADGSAKYKQGKTCVMAAVYGPAEVMRAKDELPDRATISVIFKPQSGIPGPRDKEFEFILTKALEGIILASFHPRTSITIVVQELHNDGSLLSASVIGSMCALLSAGVAVRSTLVALTCAVSKEGIILIDPDQSEEKECLGSASFVFDSVNIASSDKADDIGIVTSHTSGIFTDESYFLCLESARSGARRVASFMRTCIERKAEAESKLLGGGLAPMTAGAATTKSKKSAAQQQQQQ